MGTIESEFQKAFQKLKNEAEATGSVNRNTVDKVAIWQQFLSAKQDFQREKNAKDVGPR